MMNIQRSSFSRVDGKLSFWRSIIDGQKSFWRSIKDGNKSFWRSIYSENIKKMSQKMTLGKWRRIVLFASVVALAIDPLFLLIPVIDSDNFCIAYHNTLGIVVCVLRSVSDLFYLGHIYVHLSIEFKALRGQVQRPLIGPFKRKEFCLYLYLMVDIVSIFPLPQFVILHLIHTTSLVTKRILKWTIFCQYLPRCGRTYPIYREVTKTPGNVAESSWIGASIKYSFLYIVCSYSIGALWYLSAVQKQSKCWREACQKQNEAVKDVNGTYMYENGTAGLGCTPRYLFCTPGYTNNTAFLSTTCPLINPTEITKNSTNFNFGMFTDALKSGVLERKNQEDFTRKFIYCFRWGLRHLGALGQNLETSNSTGENLFAISIFFSGLMLFAILIGNVQHYLQSSKSRVDEKEENMRDTEKWMSKRKLPEYLKKGIRNHRDYKWRETRGMEEDKLLQSLPKHLAKGIKRHLYRDLLQKLKHVQQFQNMDDRSLEDLCSRLKTAYYTANSYIVQEGEPVEDMLYIVTGNLVSTTTGSSMLGEGYLYGEELFDWAFDPQSSHYPISNRTVTAKTDVEGFILSADDLKFVATQCGPENC